MPDANVMTRPCLILSSLLLWCMLASDAEAATSSASLSPPTLSTVIQAPEGTRSSLGGFALTLIGSRFGNKAPQAVSVAVSSFYGGEALSDLVRWTSDSSIFFSAPPGVGAGRAVSVIVGKLRSAPCENTNSTTLAEESCEALVVDYDAPEAKQVQPALSPRNGGRRVTVRGQGFGPSPVSLAPPTPPPSSAPPQSIKELSPQNVTDNVSTVNNSNNSNDSNNSISSGSGNSSSASSRRRKEVQNTTPLNETLNATGNATADGLEKTDAGKIPVGTSPNVKGMAIRIGTSECLQTEWISQTHAVCVTPPGEGLEMTVSIKVGDQWSTVQRSTDAQEGATMSYVGATPVITALFTPSAINLSGDQELQLQKLSASLAAVFQTFFCVSLGRSKEPERGAERCDEGFQPTQIMFTSSSYKSYTEWCRGQVDCDYSVLADRRDAGADGVNDGVGLSEAGVVEFLILGSKKIPDGHMRTMSAMWSIGQLGLLEPLGILALKLPDSPWQLLAPACPRGPRYNDLPCEGRGECVRGMCICKSGFSGEYCEHQAFFNDELLRKMASMTRIGAAGVLIFGGFVHVLASLTGSLFQKQALFVAGDFRSLLVCLQFVGLSSFLDTSLPTQYFEFASYFRIFALMIDPKEVVEWYGGAWREIFSIPLTDSCYDSEPFPIQRTDLIRELTSSYTLSGPGPTVLAASSQHANGSWVSPAAAYKVKRISRIPVLSSELVEGWGGKVGLDETRGALEVSFRLLCGTILCSYLFLFISCLTRHLFCKLAVWLRRYGRRKKALRRMCAAEDLHQRCILASQLASTTHGVDAEIPDMGSTELVVTGTGFGGGFSAQGFGGASGIVSMSMEKEGDQRVVVHVDGKDFGFPFGRQTNRKKSTAANNAQDEDRDEETGATGKAKVEVHEAFDENALCGACGKQGHWHIQCKDLDMHLHDDRPTSELTPQEASFPRWESYVMFISIMGLSAAVGSVLAAANAAGCDRMYAVVLVLLPNVGFQLFIAYNVHVNILSGSENKISWRSNHFAEAVTERRVLKDSNWKRSIEKAHSDYLDSFLTTGWWEEAVTLKVERISAPDGHGKYQEVPVVGGATLSKNKCDRAVEAVCHEASMVPAMFLRSKAGLEAAENSSGLDEFLVLARKELEAVIVRTAEAELPKFKIHYEQPVISRWHKTATEMLWPGNEEEYRSAIFEGHTPDEVQVSKSVKDCLSSALSSLKGAAQTEYGDPQGNFIKRYRSMFNPFAGDLSLQVHYSSVLMCLHMTSALIVAGVEGVWHGLLLILIHGLHVALIALACPYKNRFQNVKQLIQAILRAFLYLLVFMNLKRTASSNVQAAPLEATFISIIYVSLALDVISPVCGSLRAFLGIFLICTQIRHSSLFIKYHRLRRILKYLIGEPRKRSAMYLKPQGAEISNFNHQFHRSQLDGQCEIEGMYSLNTDYSALSTTRGRSCDISMGIAVTVHDTHKCLETGGGQFDTTDCASRLFVRLSIGAQMHEIAVRDTSGKNAGFKDTCMFQRRASDNTLTVVLHDSENNYGPLGEAQVDLNMMDMNHADSENSVDPVHISVTRDQRTTGRVLLSFCKGAVRSGKGNAGQKQGQASVVPDTPRTNISACTSMQSVDSVRTEKELTPGTEFLRTLANEDGEKSQDLALIKQEALVLHKWLGIHIIPRAIALAVDCTTVFCTEHMGTDEALEDLYKSRSLEAFLSLTKERFLYLMRFRMLMVVPNPEITKSLLTWPYTRPEFDRVRKSRHPRPPPPWFSPRTRKAAQILLTDLVWTVSFALWPKVRNAMCGQLLTSRPGACLFQDDVQGNALRVQRKPYEFSISEAELHSLIPKVGLPKIAYVLSCVLNDENQEAEIGDEVQDNGAG